MDSRKVHFAVAAVPRFDAAATSVECSIIMIGRMMNPAFRFLDTPPVCRG